MINPDAVSELAAALRSHQAGRLADAETVYRRVLHANPRQADAARLLGAICLQTGRDHEAVGLLSIAAELLPGDAEPQNNLGVGLERLQDLDGAEQAYRRALRLNPQYVEAWNNLGNALRQQGRLNEAEHAYREAIRLRPSDPVAFSGLGAIAIERGDLDSALEHYQMHAQRQRSAAAGSDLLFWLLHHPSYSPAAIFKLHRDWAQQYAQPLASAAASHRNAVDPNRRLRIGYISADFRQHTRARFMEPVLANHDHHCVEIFCYSDVAQHDAVTTRLRPCADTWHDTHRLNDEQLAALVRSDRIDILIDLTGHMAGNRLLTFARKPAPVQATYPGYPCTTGLSAIDYCITDASRDPPGTEGWYSETLHRIDITSQCYAPTDEDLPVADAPCLRWGAVTFASLNKPVKINRAVAAVWAQILRQLPSARLLLLAGSDGGSYLSQRLRECGIDESRVEWSRRCTRREYLELHHRIDINLDPWPYNGHTTLLDGAWMGVPAVTLEGDAHVSREGAAVMRLLGLPCCVAATPEQYVEIALALARDPQRVDQLRQSLRGRIRTSGLMNGKSLAARLEDAYCAMWRKWCERQAFAPSRP